MSLRREIVGFTIAGVLGFLIDAGVVYFAIALGAYFYVARVLSFLVAASFTWHLNRRFSFSAAPSGKPAWLEWLHYLAAMLAGGLVNYAVSVMTYAALPPSSLSPLIAVAAGSLAGMVVNFIGAKFMIFKGNA